MDVIKCEIEKCEQIDCFLIFNSFSGGTGSGMTSLVLSNMSVDFGRVKKITVSLYPSSQIASSPVEIYNFTLAFHGSLEYSDLNFCYDNEAILKYLRTQRKLDDAVFYDINKVIIQSVLAIFCPIYTDSSETTDSDSQAISTSDMLRDPTSKSSTMSSNRMCCNLVPYSRAHFLIPSLAESSDSRLQPSSEGDLISNLTDAVLTYDNYLLDFSPVESLELDCKHLRQI